MASPAPRRRLPSPCRRKKALSIRCQLICWQLLPTFLGGLGTQPIKGGLRRGKCQRDKQALQIFLGRLQLDDAGCVQGFQNSTSLLPSCGKSLFWMCMALVTSMNMAGGACKCGVGSLVHRRDLRNNQGNAGYPEGFGMVERSSLSFCCRELICDSEVRASRVCPSKPPDKNQSITM